MQFNSKPLKFSNSQKSRCNDCVREKSPCSACSKALYSPLQGQENLSNQHNLSSHPPTFKGLPPQNKKAPFVIPGRFKSGEEIQKTNRCNSCEKDTTRLCLNCNKTYCDGCALDHHEEYEDHKILKLSKVVETIPNEKNKLDKNIADLENLVNGKALKIKEDELMDQVDLLYGNYFQVLEHQRQTTKNEIQKKLASLAAVSSKNAQSLEAFKWISNAKALSIDIEKSNITDNNSILCSLYQQEEGFKKLDSSKLKNDCDTAALEKSLNQIQIQCNNQLLEALKKENIIEIKTNQSVRQAIQSFSGNQIPLKNCLK